MLHSVNMDSNYIVALVIFILLVIIVVLSIFYAQLQNKYDVMSGISTSCSTDLTSANLKILVLENTEKMKTYIDSMTVYDNTITSKFASMINEANTLYLAGPLTADNITKYNDIMDHIGDGLVEPIDIQPSLDDIKAKITGLSDQDADVKIFNDTYAQYIILHDANSLLWRKIAVIMGACIRTKNALCTSPLEIWNMSASDFEIYSKKF
jgi:hypothetical protein